MIIDQLFTRPLFEAADPSRLIVSVRIEPMSTGGEPIDKEVDLTGQFQGSMGSQMNQALDYMKKMLESKDLYFTTLKVSYQGRILNMQNRGAMSPQSDEEREMDAMANQIRAKRQITTPTMKEEAPMASPEQIAYNQLRAQWNGYQAMTSGGGNTAVSRDPAHAAKLATVPAELARMAAALKAKGIDAEAQYDALSGPKSAPVDANQAYGGISENKSDPITQFASNAHEAWRRNFDPTGTKPRIKKNSDGTEGDINVPFADLHPDWQKENLAAAHAAQHAVKHFGNNMEKAAEFIHRQWMKRNPKADYNAAQHVPYDDLSDDEKEKDRVHVRTMMRLMGHQTNESGLRKFSHKKNRFKSLHKLRNPLGEEGTNGSEGSLNEFAPGGEDGNSPYAYGMAILGYAEDYKQIHRKSSSTDDDVADIIEIGNTFLNKGMAAGIAALFSVDTFVSDSIVDDLAEQGFNVMADLIDKRPRSAQWHQQMAAGQQALADYEANRKKSSEETDGSKAVDTLARVLKSSLKDYQAADGDKNKLKQLGLLIGLSDNHRSAIHHALQQIQQNDFDGAIKSLVATPPGASGPGYDALDYGYSKQKAGVSVQQLIQFIRKHFELSEQGVAEGLEQKPAITYKDYTLQYDYQTEDDDPEGYSTATTYYFDVLKDGDRVGEAEYFDYFGNLTIRINGKTKEFGFRHPLASQISQLVSSLPDEQKKDLSDPRFESQDLTEVFADQGSGSTDRDNADYMKRRRAAKKAGYTGRETKAGTWRVFKDGNAVAAAGPFKSADEAAAWIKKHKQGVTEMDKSEPSAGRDTGPRSGPDKEAKPITAKKATRDAAGMLNRAFQDSHKKKDVKEGEIEQTKTGIRHRGHRYGSGEDLPNGGGNRSGFPNPGKYARDLDNLDKGLTSKLDHSMGVSWPKGRKKQDMDENINPLMLKLKRALIKEGRVKELADDLKTMSDADFMKKYGKAKAAIRKDMKRVDEATPAVPAAPAVAINNPTMTSRTIGAPELSTDPVQNFKNGVTDAKEFYDLARKAGIPISDAIPMAYAKGQATATGDIGGFVKTVTDKATGTAEKGLAQLQSTIKDYADLYAQFQPNSEYYKKNIAPNPQLKAQADEFIRTNMTPQQYAQSIQQAQAQLKAPRAMPTQASATVPSNPAAPINELSTNQLARYKTAAAKDAKEADKAGDVKRGDKRFGGIVKATKKQFDNDAKKIDESRRARQALMAQIVNSR